MYIITKLASVAQPAKNRQIAKTVEFVARSVVIFPTKANMFETTKTCSLPILSAKIPKSKLPITDPIKNTDWPIAGFQLSSQTQFS